MPRKTISVAAFNRRMKNLPKKLETAVAAACVKASARLVGDVVKSIDKHKPFPVVDRGMMRNSVQMEVLEQGAHVFVGAPYANAQEHGTRPFFPPLAPLVAWAERKGHEDPHGFARAVQHKIGRDGIEPKHFFRNAVKRWKARGTLDREVKKALRRAAGRNVG